MSAQSSQLRQGECVCVFVGGGGGGGTVRITGAFWTQAVVSEHRLTHMQPHNNLIHAHKQ